MQEVLPSRVGVYAYGSHSSLFHVVLWNPWKYRPLDVDEKTNAEDTADTVIHGTAQAVAAIDPLAITKVRRITANSTWASNTLPKVAVVSLDATELQHLFCGLIGWDRPSHAKLCLQGTGTFGRRGLDGRVTNSAFDLSFLYCDVDANKNTKFSFGGMFPVTTNELGSGALWVVAGFPGHALMRVPVFTSKRVMVGYPLDINSFMSPTDAANTTYGLLLAHPDSPLYMLKLGFAKSVWRPPLSNGAHKDVLTQDEQARATAQWRVPVEDTAGGAPQPVMKTFENTISNALLVPYRVSALAYLDNNRKEPLVIFGSAASGKTAVFWDSHTGKMIAFLHCDRPLAVCMAAAVMVSFTSWIAVAVFQSPDGLASLTCCLTLRSSSWWGCARRAVKEWPLLRTVLTRQRCKCLPVYSWDFSPTTSADGDSVYLEVRTSRRLVFGNFGVTKCGDVFYTPSLQAPINTRTVLARAPQPGVDIHKMKRAKSVAWEDPVADTTAQRGFEDSQAQHSLKTTLEVYKGSFAGAGWRAWNGVPTGVPGLGISDSSQLRPLTSLLWPYDDALAPACAHHYDISSVEARVPLYQSGCVSAGPTPSALSLLEVVDRLVRATSGTGGPLAHHRLDAPIPQSESPLFIELAADSRVTAPAFEHWFCAPANNKILFTLGYISLVEPPRVQGPPVPDFPAGVVQMFGETANTAPPLTRAHVICEAACLQQCRTRKLLGFVVACGTGMPAQQDPYKCPLDAPEFVTREPRILSTDGSHAEAALQGGPTFDVDWSHVPGLPLDATDQGSSSAYPVATLAARPAPAVVRSVPPRLLSAAGPGPHTAYSTTAIAAHTVTTTTHMLAVSRLEAGPAFSGGGSSATAPPAQARPVFPAATTDLGFEDRSKQPELELEPEPEPEPELELEPEPEPEPELTVSIPEADYIEAVATVMSATIARFADGDRPGSVRLPLSMVPDPLSASAAHAHARWAAPWDMPGLEAAPATHADGDVDADTRSLCAAPYSPRAGAGLVEETESYWAAAPNEDLPLSASQLAAQVSFQDAMEPADPCIADDIGAYNAGALLTADNMDEGLFGGPNVQQEEAGAPPLGTVMNCGYYS